MGLHVQGLIHASLRATQKRAIGSPRPGGSEIRAMPATVLTTTGYGGVECRDQSLGDGAQKTALRIRLRIATPERIFDHGVRAPWFSAVARAAVAADLLVK